MNIPETAVHLDHMRRLKAADAGPALTAVKPKTHTTRSVSSTRSPRTPGL